MDKSKLVKKRITDKTGKVTTVWVKMNQPESGGDIHRWQDKIPKGNNGLEEAQAALFNTAKKRGAVTDSDLPQLKSLTAKILEVDKKGDEGAKYPTTPTSAFAEAIQWTMTKDLANDPETLISKEKQARIIELGLVPKDTYKNMKLALVDRETGEVVSRGHDQAAVDYLIGTKKVLSKDDALDFVRDSSLKNLKVDPKTGAQYHGEAAKKIKGGVNPEDYKPEVYTGAQNQRKNMEFFEELAKKSKSPEEFVKNIRKHRDVPQSTADAFMKKYGQGGKISPEKAAEAMWNEAHTFKGKPIFAIKDIPDVRSEVKAGKVTYRGLGADGAGYTRIKVKGKEYIITSEDFDKLGGLKKIKFNAPQRKSW